MFCKKTLAFSFLGSFFTARDLRWNNMDKAIDTALIMSRIENDARDGVSI